MTTSTINIYGQVREMAANFEFKPGERVNESELSKSLGASRTPLREALNRLVAEGLLRVKEGKGFYCRSLSPEIIMNLYELREAIETSAIRLAVERSTDDELADVRKFQNEIKPRYSPNTSAQDLVHLDETFHMRLVALSRNAEMIRALENLYEQIRYVRWIAIRHKIDITHSAHSEILEAVEARDATDAAAKMSSHVRTRTEEATNTVREAYSQLYVPDSGLQKETR